MTPEQERAEFEAFESKHGLCVTKEGELYRSHVVRWMWKAWQARAAIEAYRKRRGEPSKCPECSDPDLSPEKHWQDGYDDGVAAALRRGEPVALMREAALHLTNWLDKDECECDGPGHYCGRTQVERCRDRLLDASQQPAEPVSQHPDDAAVGAFAVTMKAKLKRARDEKGRGGWQDMSAAELSAMLREHVEKGDPVDVANLAMMLSLNGQRIVPAEPVKVQHVDDINVADIPAVSAEHATLNLQPFPRRKAQ